MNLSHSQKKYLKKNLKKIPLNQIANNLNISETEVLQYLKTNWPKEKYKRFLKNLKGQEQQTNVQEKTLPTINLIDKVAHFNFKNFFKKNWKILVYLSFLVFIVYFNSLNNNFVSDDVAAIKTSPTISKINYFWEPPYFNLRLKSLTNFIVYKFFGPNPIFFRLLNILFHLGSTWMIFIIIGFFFSLPFAFLTAAIFAVHPILIESVTWISGGPYSGGAFFAFLAFLTYLLFCKNQKGKFYYFSIIFFIMALLFSEKLIVLPIILLFYEICFGQFKKNWRRLIPFFALSLFFGLELLGLLGERMTSLETNYYQEPGLENPFIQIPIAISSYLSLIFWPKDLTLYHSELTFSQGQYFLRLGIFLLFLGLTIFFFKKDRRVFFWLVFFIISLLVTLTPLKISWVVAERYVYFGSLGIFVFIVWLITKMGVLIKNQKISWFIFALIILALSTRTIIRNFNWKNQDTLWLSAAKTSPSSHQNHNNLGDLYARHGDYQKAVEEFQKAIELKPNYGDAYHNLGNVYHQMGKDDLSEQSYSKALSFNPNLWQSYQNLAAIHFSQKNYQLAKEELEKAIQIKPDNTDLHANLGILYLNLQDKQKAKEEFQKALQIDPQNQKAQQQLELIK